MHALYSDVRKAILRAIFVMIIATTVMDVAFFFLYLFLGDLSEPPFLYILLRMVPPLVINLLSYRIAKYAGALDRLPDRSKNYAVSFSLCTFCGVTGIFHSYFVSLWALPGIALLFCTVFGDKRLIRLLSIYNYILAGLCFLYVMIDRPGNFYMYVQNLVIVLAIDIVVYLIGQSMMQFMLGMRSIQNDLYHRSLDYKEQLEVDYLTGVSSRSHMTKEAQKRLYRASQFNPVSVAIIDIDNFKSINDTFGHENGDVVLKELGTLLTTQLKDDVEVGRYGGEEFVIIFEGVSTGMHQIRLDRVRQLFSEIHYDFTDRRITFSGGIKSVIDPAEFAPTLQKADEALYISKNTGKNKITPAA